MRPERSAESRSYRISGLSICPSSKPVCIGVFANSFCCSVTNDPQIWGHFVKQVERHTGPVISRSYCPLMTHYAVAKQRRKSLASRRSVTIDKGLSLSHRDRAFMTRLPGIFNQPARLPVTFSMLTISKPDQSEAIIMSLITGESRKINGRWTPITLMRSRGCADDQDLSRT